MYVDVVVAGTSALQQIQGGRARAIALYDPERGRLEFSARPLWPGGGGPPVARRLFRVRVVTVAPVAFAAVTAFALLGVALALALLALNCIYRRRRAVKLSSPRLNSMTCVGCVLVYAAVIALGLDSATVPAQHFARACAARALLLSAGFSLALGPVLTKTYRVHRIFVRGRGAGVRVRQRLLRDTQLISLVCVLLLVDVLVVGAWLAVDPMHRQLRNLSLEVGPTVVYQPQVSSD